MFFVEERIDLIDVEVGGIEAAADPLFLVLVLWVARIFQRLEEFLIAGRTANILRRASVGAVDAKWLRQ